MTRKTWTTSLISASLVAIPNISMAQTVLLDQGLTHWFSGGLDLVLLGGPLIMLWLWRRGPKPVGHPAVTLENEELSRLQDETRDALLHMEEEYEQMMIGRIQGGASPRPDTPVHELSKDVTSC